MDESEQQFREAMRKGDEQAASIAKQVGAMRAMSIMMKYATDHPDPLMSIYALRFVAAITELMPEVTKP